jgi:hypothetical protein
LHIFWVRLDSQNIHFWDINLTNTTAAATIKTGPRYFAMMLMVPGVYTGYVVSLAWIVSKFPFPPQMKLGHKIHTTQKTLFEP